MTFVSPITRAETPATTQPACNASDPATAAKAQLLVDTLNARISLALSIVATRIDMPRITRNRLDADLRRKRQVIRNVVGDGCAPATYVLGTLGPNGHLPGIECVLSSVERAVAALDTAAASERRAAVGNGENGRG